MIHVQKIVKAFGRMRALDGVSFSIAQGQYVALLGANGAGKTTLMHILATLSRPTAGHVEIAGYSSKKHPNSIRQRIGFIGHAGLLYDELTAEENLRFFSRMYGISDSESRIGQLLQEVGLLARRHDKVRTFSRGMHQRLSFARALLHYPPILLLDEPFAGLDLNATVMVKNLLDKFIAEEKTVLLTVHDIDYALYNAKRILVLNRGKLIVNKAANELRRDQLQKVLEA
ncbi:heme ABC exporter ATP-binding protein CcmA [candidate division KSB1 bacterium]|nr:heme ABC exporter ATP-binding protein CcmA [candidate division KSB1 bacterium]RQW07147.1 MAG: heme ABC exporter ATP-binding protein CcmA [candidate division KSB1 bacterium]